MAIDLDAELNSPRGAIVLAGGDATGLRTPEPASNRDVPIQFCAPTGDETMLEQTLRRAAISIPPLRTLTVLNRKHAAFYAPLGASIPTRNLVVQPSNCGTAGAILYGLFRLAAHEQVASVAILPSDHCLSDERQFMRHVNIAFAAVEARPELTVILGMAALGPESGYGWIEPGDRIAAGETEVRAVRRFVEKPCFADAVDLMRGGALWSSMVVVARVSTLLGSIMIAEPD
ncbi:MAG TPA: sugar phosphate nucleotidyltransferase, partial [Candidatus Acidoferrales bacterium]|nr:sugar phosphate nucleotidyltransferase [Candidatus Acidoferrales bacterium]